MKIMSRRNIILSIVFCMSVAVWAQDKQLVILHTNDTHSCVQPLSKNLADTLFAGRGGYLRRIAMLEEERAKYPDLLLFDSGDFSQGSPYYNLYGGEVEVGLMNRMHYDAATIGNHEFDFGLENMARIFKMADFPIVCSNYDFAGTPVQGLVKRYVIIKRDGLKIGVFGLGPKLEGLVSDYNCEGVRFIDPVIVAQEMADLLKGEKKCDIVICLSHLGWDKVNTLTDGQMMSKTKGIDLVLGGHSHTFLKELQYVKNADGIEVANDQNGKSGIYIGKMIVNLTRSRK
jgi:5'-nucleotidase